jgi:protein-S-isoprenylcysteine O-methyltransferase Ste14
MDFDFLIRALILIILLISFSISAFYRKKARDESGTIKRQEEGWVALVLRLGFALPLLTVLLLNIFYPAALSWAHFSSPFYLQIIGLILAMLCVPFLWWVLSTIGKNISETVLTKHSHELVISGPYAKVRHPLYSGAIILLFAISLVFGDWIILGYSIVSLLAFRLLIIPTEEKQLLEAFGEDYEYYQARTGALLPWIR